ncbi:MAG: hypothetical protein Q9188_003519 [Gyalolechia gomerana]
MAFTGGDSPRAFDVADSQADMDWLRHHHDHAQTPTNIQANDPSSPANEIEGKDVKDLNDQHFITRGGGNLDAQHSPTIKAEEAGEENGHMITDTAFVDLTLGEHFPEVKKEYVEEQPFDWRETVSDQIELSDSEDGQLIKQELPASLTGWKDMPRHIEISDTEDEHGQTVQDQSSLGANATCDPQLQQPSEAIHVPDNGSHQEQTVSSNDKMVEDGQVANSSEHPLLTAAPKNKLGNFLLRTPNSKAKRSAADIATMKTLQAKFRAKALGRNKGANGSSGVDGAIAVDGEHASTEGPPTAPVGNFLDHESDMNRIIEDDDQNGNIESEDTLFLPQGNLSRSLKRPLAATVETDKDGSDQDVQEIDGSTVPDTRGKPKRKRQQKPQALTPEALKQIHEREANASLAAALQQFTTNDRKGKNAHKPNADLGHSRSEKGKKKEVSGSRDKPKRQKKRNNKMDPRAQAFVAGLQPHDVLAEANANLDRDALPSVDERDKQKYLKALLHSVPKDDRPGVRGEKTRLYKAATSFGHGVVTSTDSGWRFKGMKSQLLHHQLLGASFMRKRELGSEQPYGGLLADEMGFGKTVMMIVTMVTNPPQASEKHKSTLIICSPALMLQWRRELAVHASDNIFRKVLVHSGSSKLEGEGCEAVLEEADVVLTTYGQVVRSYPLNTPPEHLETAEEKRKWAEKHWSDKRGLLHRAHFHRVVLDEAQAIKNHKAHTSLACQAIMARYRWAISGTPIMNRLEELYPYFKFLRVQYSGSFDDFKKNFCGKGDPLYTDRLHACLQAFMLRRTHRDLIFGKPIIKLPECHPKTINLRPTKVEVSIYRAVEMRYTQAVNAIAKIASEEHLKRLVMAMITRLRQMTAHLFLVQHIMQDIFEMDDMKQLYYRLN